MKKLFTLLMALSLVGGIYANPRLSIDKSQMDKNLLKKAGLVSHAAARKALLEDVALGDTIEPIYYGNWNYYMIEDTTDYDYYRWEEWSILLSDEATGNVLLLDFDGNKRDELNGTYALDSYYSYIKVGRDSLDINSGSVTIAWASVDENGIISYNFQGSVVASDNQTYTFNTTVPVYDAMDYVYAYTCYYYNSYCDAATITLLDAPAVEPSGATIEVVMHDNYVWDYTETLLEGLYYIISNTDEDGNGYEAYIVTKGSTVVGTFDNDNFDADYTNFYENGARLKLAEISGTVSQNDTCYNYEFYARAAHTGDVYHITGSFDNVLDIAYRNDAQATLDLTMNGDSIYLADYASQEGYIGAYIFSKDLFTTYTGTIMQLFFFVDESAAGSVIPVGQYEINNSATAGTCWASTGYSSEYGDDPLYIAQYDEGYSDGLWYVVSGTVTVTYEDDVLGIEVEGTNYLGEDVYVNFIAGGIVMTGIEQVVVEGVEGVKKQLIDGHMIIVRDGKAFNLVGARVK